MRTITAHVAAASLSLIAPSAAGAEAKRGFGSWGGGRAVARAPGPLSAESAHTIAPPRSSPPPPPPAGAGRPAPGSPAAGRAPPPRTRARRRPAPHRAPPPHGRRRRRP